MNCRTFGHPLSPESRWQQILCSFLPVDLFSYFPPPVLKQMATAGSKRGKKAEKLTFSLNGGGMGRRDAAVTMQRRLGILLSSHPAKTRFMTSRIPSYFSSWCTLSVVYLGLRALQLSPSLWGFYDLQNNMQQEVAKRTLCCWSLMYLPHGTFSQQILAFIC